MVRQKYAHSGKINIDFLPVGKNKFVVYAIKQADEQIYYYTNNYFGNTRYGCNIFTTDPRKLASQIVSLAYRTYHKSQESLIEQIEQDIINIRIYKKEITSECLKTNTKITLEDGCKCIVTDVYSNSIAILEKIKPTSYRGKNIVIVKSIHSIWNYPKKEDLFYMNLDYEEREHRISVNKLAYKILLRYETRQLVEENTKITDNIHMLLSMLPKEDLLNLLLDDDIKHIFGFKLILKYLVYYEMRSRIAALKQSYDRGQKNLISHENLAIIRKYLKESYLANCKKIKSETLG